MSGVGFVFRIIGALPSTIANQYVMFSNERGPDPGCQNLLSFISKMTVEQFISKVIAKGISYNYPNLARSNIGDTTKLLLISQIPPFLVYSGFEKELNILEVLEYVLDMYRDGGGKDMTLHLKQSLLFFLSRHNSNNPKPYVHSEIMMQTPSSDAKKIGK